MAGSGQIYVEVKADSINSGISLLDASGATGSGEGGETGIYWILWEYTVVGDTVTGGYTGESWYWNTPNNYLATGWSNYALTLGNSEKYTQDYNGFLNYLIDNPNLHDLNEILGAWPPEEKGAFATQNQGILGANNCFTFGTSPH